MDELVIEKNSNRQVTDSDSSKSNLSPSMKINFSEQSFNEFQKKIKTEIMDSLYPNVLEDDLDDFEDNIEDSNQFYEREPTSVLSTSFSKSGNKIDAIFNKIELNVYKSNSQVNNRMLF